MELGEVVRRFDRRSRHYWERPRLGVRIRWPGDGSELVYVPAGRFLMGRAEGDTVGDDDERPQHEVELSAFWLQRTPVTNRQYARFVAATGYRESEKWREYAEGRELHPVIYMSWHDAQAYCEWAGLRLPTEAEWEYAGRGPEGRKYPWGNEWDGSRLCWEENRGEGEVRTLPVGSFSEGASWCDALDLAGNVWEWCADWYGEDYYRESPPLDPQGPATGEYRVLRGGSWLNGFELSFQCALRGSIEPSHRDDDIGFRCARTV